MPNLSLNFILQKKMSQCIVNTTPLCKSLRHYAGLVSADISVHILKNCKNPFILSHFFPQWGQTIIRICKRWLVHRAIQVRLDEFYLIFRLVFLSLVGWLPCLFPLISRSAWTSTASPAKTTPDTMPRLRRFIFIRSKYASFLCQISYVYTQ